MQYKIVEENWQNNSSNISTKELEASLEEVLDGVLIENAITVDTDQDLKLTDNESGYAIYQDVDGLTFFVINQTCSFFDSDDEAIVDYIDTVITDLQCM